MSMALQNIMGCKVFRLLRMSMIEHDASTQAESSVRFATWYTTTHTLSSDDAEVIQPVPVSVSLHSSIWAQHWQINIHSSTSSYEKTTPCASFSGQLPYCCFILISVWFNLFLIHTCVFGEWTRLWTAQHRGAVRYSPCKESRGITHGELHRNERSHANTRVNDISPR